MLPSDQMSLPHFPKLLFINTSRPEGLGSSKKEQRHMMASHAVRIAHARARLRQTKQFQAQQSQQKRKMAAVEKAHTHQSDTLDSIATPLSRLSTELMLSRGAFETPVKAPYEFLFHHCTLVPSRPKT
jgi:hypothetical protein